MEMRILLLFAVLKVGFIEAALLNSSTEAAMSLGVVRAVCGNGYCRLTTPVCCNGGFCVSGGDKCCASTTNSEYDKSCDQNELCCPGEVPSCCAQGESCNMDGSCATNACSSHPTPYACTLDTGCAWCCSDRRCVSAPPTSPPICVSGPSIAGAGAVCNACYEAATCGQCGQLSGCSWCCDSQSCLPTINATCYDYQRIDMNGNASTALQVCSGCLGLGQGLLLEDIEENQFGSVFGVVGGICIVIAVATISRYMIVRRMQAHLWNDLSVAEVYEVHVSVRRYGFRHQEPSETTTESTAPSDAAVPLPVSSSCAVCKVHLATIPQGAADPEPNGSDSIEDRQQQYVVFLPCGHATCIRCLGLPGNVLLRLGGARRSSVAETALQGDPHADEASPIEQESHAAEGEEGGVPLSNRGSPARFSSKGAEHILMAHVKKKCAVCANEIDDVLQAERLISSAPSS